ncbi:hypothetical protein BC628DRAFT_717795 [Trametes gibbosa]|nr:hypothetical protein BC628DRAFT_717795 [Trametes gibbosa]
MYRGSRPCPALYLTPDSEAPLGCSGPDFLGISLNHLPGNRTHHLNLSPLRIPPEMYTMETSNTNAHLLSAPPSAFSLPGPASTAFGRSATGGAYLYQLLNDSLGGPVATEPPPFSSTCHFEGALSGLEDVPPDLWSPMHDFGAPVPSQTTVASAYGLGLGLTEATPVAYQIRLSDLVALTKSLRGEGCDDAQGSGTPSLLDTGSVMGVHDDNLGTTRSGEATEDEDSDEAVTPALEEILLLGHVPPTERIDGCGLKGEAVCRGMADIACEEQAL